MTDNEKDFDPRESLQVIRSMIESTRHSFSDSSPYFLLWGWAVLLACLTQFVLLQLEYKSSGLAWLVVIPLALIIYFIMIAKRTKLEKVKTFVGEASGYLWTALGFCFAAFPFIFSRIGWEYCLPFYILMYGVGTYVSGKLISFAPLVWGGISCLLLAVVTPYFAYQYQLLIASLAIITSYIIPGHLLRAQYRKQKTN